MANRAHCADTQDKDAWLSALKHERRLLDGDVYFERQASATPCGMLSADRC